MAGGSFIQGADCPVKNRETFWSAPITKLLSYFLLVKAPPMRYRDRCPWLLRKLERTCEHSVGGDWWPEHRILRTSDDQREFCPTAHMHSAPSHRLYKHIHSHNIFISAPPLLVFLGHRLVTWHSGNAFHKIDEVTLCRAELVLERATACGQVNHLSM